MDGSNQQDATRDTAFKPTRKRKRIVISCTECHRRKQKCDRLFPCSNCVFRNKQSACHYESEATISKIHSNSARHNASSEEGSRSPVHGRPGGMENIKLESDSAARLSALGYSKSTGHNSLGIFKKIENHEDGGQSLPDRSSLYQPDYNGLKERYKSLVRQLPARTFVDQLLVTFFKEVNWHYSPIDEELFMEHLQNWNSVSFSVLNRGPQDLPADIRYFPALLFQVVALALQFQPPRYDPSLDSLKYVSEMSLDDLANDYSESGVAILSLLGKRDITLVTIQAGFLRTSFLKNSGMVTESWHSLGQTIRDAQEIGWHLESVDRETHDRGKCPEALWLEEVRRRVWCDLQMWDIHMGLVLGRSTSIDFTDVNIRLPIDALPSTNRKEAAPLPKSESDPPTPVTILIIHCQFIIILRDILALEKEGVHLKDYTKVESIQQDILKLVELLPPCFRSHNPDTRFDDRPECHWLPATRQLFDTAGAFVTIILHKPYVFTNPNSRYESLKAGLTILRAQRRLFQLLEAQHYKLFNLVLSTFDTIVLLSAIYILHPAENLQYLSDYLQQFEWAMERFELLCYRNQMAKAAMGVLQAVQVRLKKSIARHAQKISSGAAQIKSSTVLPQRQPVESPTSTSSSNGYVTTPQVPESIRSSLSTNSVHTSNTSSLGISEYSSVTEHTTNPSLGAVAPVVSSDSQWATYTTAFPPEFNASFDFSGMAPLQPTHDLLFNDLVGMSDDPAPAVAANAQTFYDPGPPWQFEGEFRDDSFWNFMNQYNL